MRISLAARSSSLGTASNTQIDAGGEQHIEATGLSVSATVNSGGLQNVDGTANFATVNDGAPS